MREMTTVVCSIVYTKLILSILQIPRWDDDVVFKNCAKGDESRTSRGFINDTLRSEFHKKFMEKYVK